MGGTHRWVVRGTELGPADGSDRYFEKLARIMLDEMQQFVGVLDIDGTLLECNRASLEVGGLTPDEVIGKPLWECFWWTISPKTQADLRDAVRRAALGEAVRYDVDVYASRAGGTMTVDFTLVPVKDDEGRIVLLLPEARDITDKRAREQEIVQKNVDLYGLVERIRELDETKTQFFANVSHELRTPLALILGPAQRLIDDDGSMSPTLRQESAEVIARSGRMLLRLVDGLFEISKLEAGRAKLELANTDLSALVRELSTQFDVLASDRGVRYEVDASEPCVLAVDADKLQRVVMNLLANAFKFVPDGGRVRCRLFRTAAEVVLSVEDSGPGVRPEMRDVIFERFRQGDGDTERSRAGVGLGLAIAKELVEMHEGRVEVLDSELRGAAFRVVLPLRPTNGLGVEPPVLQRDMLMGWIEELRSNDRSRRRTDPPPHDWAGHSTNRVLVVEDNPDMSRFITQCLSLDYDVIVASDGRDGLAKARRWNPALVVSDVMMPNMGGVEMVAEMRKEQGLDRIPILLLSARADEELMVGLLDNGVQDYIVKPFSEKVLKVRVRNLIQAHQSRMVTMDALARHHAAREEAELQKRLLHSLFMQAPSLIAYLRGPDHVVELANPPIRRVWGHELDEILDQPLFEVVPELRDQVFPALLADVYQTGVPYHGKETPARFVRQDGTMELLYFNFVYSPVRMADGAIDGVLVLAADVTAEVVTRGKVDAFREAAETANRAKDDFLAMLGHELRNPLSPIVTALHVMKLRPDDALHARTIIERQVAHLTRLVDDLLDVSRIARGKVDLKREIVDLTDVVAHAVEMTRPLVEQRQHVLSVQVPRGLCVNGDPIRLGQVVSNLVTNAAKYTPVGGRIDLVGDTDGADVVLRVRDTGIGITEELLPTVFDLFVQERQAIDRSQGGLGIGLAIVRSLIEEHGGSVDARSDGAGRGSEFSIRLPNAARTAARREPLSAKDAEVRTRAAPRAPRVLVVDDNEDGAEMLSEALKWMGYDTRVAHDAPAALRLAKEFTPNVAVLDIGLPVMDGYELAAHLRDLPGLGEVCLIAVTGYGQESDRRKTHAAGFHHHFVKPIEVEAIEAVVSSLT